MTCYSFQPNNLPQMHLKTDSKRAFQKFEKATGDLIGKKIDDKITKVSRTSPQNSSDTVQSEPANKEFDKEIPKERY